MILLCIEDHLKVIISFKNYMIPLAVNPFKNRDVIYYSSLQQGNGVVLMC